MDVPWWVVGIFVMAFALVVVWVLRSIKNWRHPPAGKDSDAQDAEAELWSTRNMGQR